MSNSGVLDCSFLEVTINSNKLMQLLESLMKQINQHHSQIKILRQAIPTIKKSVTTSLEATEDRIKLETQRNALKAKQEIKFIKAHYQLIEQQLMKFTIQCQKKFKDKDIEIAHLQEQRKRTQSLINIYEENRLASHTAIQQKIQSVKEDVEKLTKQVSQADTKTDDKMEMMFVKMQSMIRKNNMNMRSADGSFDIKQPRKSIGPKGFKSTINSTNLTNWAAFSTKISEIEKKYEQKQENLPQVNKVMFSKKIQQGTIKAEESFDNSLNTSGENLKQNADSFSSLFSLCNKQNQKCMQNLKNKLIVQQQKLSLYCRKMQKLMQTQTEFKLMFKKFEEKKNDEHNIEIVRTQVKKLQLELAQDVDKKLNKESYEKQKNKLLEKISIVQENLTEKADKGDMKKAFLFMEEKIKQLIILIASDQSEEKDGAIRKVNAKCLSCDKGLEIQQSPVNTPLTSRENQCTIRNLTKKIRTRVHTSNQNSVVNM